MAVNLPPHYHDAEDEYRKAQTAADRLAALQKMWTILPKHKASEKVQAELKQKLAAARTEAEQEKKAPKKGGGVSYKFPRQGAGQYILVGPPNAGKSSLLAKFTSATPEIAAYPFTTREPGAGMMAWEDVRVQLIDTPPVTVDVLEPYVSNLIRAADGAILVLDLADDDGPFAVEAVLEKLAGVKTVLTGTPPTDPEDLSIHHARTLLVANKHDAADANDRLAIAREMFGERFPIQIVSCETGAGLEELRTLLYQHLNVIRVYTKLPGKPADMTSPFTVPAGSTVAEFAGRVHKDFEASLKSARVWGTGVFEGQTVKRDHRLHDKDVVELNV